ncbi:putative integral membrane protein GPR137C [Sciurus carolinensis]|uniref:Integral membrane protein GPR137C n=1 Tax=Sciurus carolinensis TaxID=30640 RepID=A0AA41MGJ8_SCICA|nr:putative integral membrane protein GPR137C [Sciurus carolinensis]
MEQSSNRRSLDPWGGGGRRREGWVQELQLLCKRLQVLSRRFQGLEAGVCEGPLMRVSGPGPAATVAPTASRKPSTLGASGRGGVIASASGAGVPGSVQLALSVLHALL